MPRTVIAPDRSPTLETSFHRLSTLVSWALLTATVGLIPHVIRDRAGWLGRFVVDLIGTAWNVATFLVVPAVIIDDLGALSGHKRSGSLLRQT